MSVVLTINGTNYLFPSLSTDKEWGGIVTTAIQALSNPNNTVYKNQIVNDVTTGGTTVPLSAEQGKTLKALIDAIDVTNYINKDGSVALTSDWDAGSYEIRAKTLESDVATGTAPFTVASITVVSNLNADMVDGKEANEFLEIANIDDTPADDANVPVSSKWIYDNIYSAYKVQTIIEKTTDYTITDTDGYVTIIIGDTDNDRTITLPTAADNVNRIIEIRNNNSYTYDGSNDNSRKITVDGEDAETLDYLGIQQTTIDIEIINAGIRLKSNGVSWDILDTFVGELLSISGTLEMVYSKILIGTLDSDAVTTIAHGVNFDKILRCTGHTYNSTATVCYVYDNRDSNSVNDAFSLRFNATNIEFVNVGANIQGNNYKVMFEYYI